MHVYQEIACHIIFDVNMDLTRRARFSNNVSKTEVPVFLNYSSVVSRDSVWQIDGGVKTSRRLIFIITSV